MANSYTLYLVVGGVDTNPFAMGVLTNDDLYGVSYFIVSQNPLNDYKLINDNDSNDYIDFTIALNMLNTALSSTLIMDTQDSTNEYYFMNINYYNINKYFWFTVNSNMDKYGMYTNIIDIYKKYALCCENYNITYADIMVNNNVVITP